MPSVISAGTTAGTAIAITGDTTGNLAFQTNGTTTAMTIDTSQNVGIGTTNPSVFSSTTNLAVGTGSSTASLTVFTGTAQTGAVYFADGTSGADRYRGAIEYTHSNNALLFTTDASERMRITSGGAVLVNETSTSFAPLMQVTGSAGTYNLFVVKQTQTSYGTGVRLITFLNSSDAIAGVISHSGVTSVTYGTSSDQRLKENIVDAPNALDKVMNIKVRSYDWKEDSSHVEYGLVAQEVNANFKGLSRN